MDSGKTKFISKYCRHQCAYYSVHNYQDLRNILPLLLFRNYRFIKFKKVLQCMIGL
jgi:hypothetical protein